MVVKRDGRLQEFEKEKILSRVTTACAKRPIASRVIERMVEDVEETLQALGRAEIPSATIGEMVLDRLRELDRVAYVRWASVHRNFQDLESFELVVRDLRQETIQPPNTSQLTMLDDEFDKHKAVRSKRRSRMAQ